MACACDLDTTARWASACGEQELDGGDDDDTMINDCSTELTVVVQSPPILLHETTLFRRLYSQLSVRQYVVLVMIMSMTIEDSIPANLGQFQQLATRVKHHLAVTGKTKFLCLVSF